MRSAVSKYLAEIGKRGGRTGGKARMAALTADERKALATASAKARWAKRKPKEKRK